MTAGLLDSELLVSNNVEDDNSLEPLGWSHYDKKKLPKIKKIGKQLLPSSQNSRMSWLLHGEPSHTEISTIPGGPLLDCKGMDAHRLRQILWVEQVVPSHPHLNASVLPSGASLITKANRFQCSLTGKIYDRSMRPPSPCVKPESSLLMAYEVELEEEMTAKLHTKLWEEICIVTDHCLHLDKVAVQATGQSLGLMVLQERVR